MRLDREYQKELLTLLVDAYPLAADVRALTRGMSAEEEHRYAANMVYLEEHGLVVANVDWSIDNVFQIGLPKATAFGNDFLADDGGLSAILGVVTVKLHGDTIKELIEQKIMESSLDQTDKPRFVAALRSLPADATKHLAMKLMDLGLAHAPDALHAIQTFLAQHLR